LLGAIRGPAIEAATDGGADVAEALGVGGLADGGGASGGALVPMGEAAYSFGSFRQIAGYEVAGTSGLVGSTYNLNIWGISSNGTGLGLSSLVRNLRAEAAAAGATRISIVGVEIINRGFLKLSPAAAARFGLDVKVVNNKTIILQGSLP
jgi:hypothetical protein